MNENYESVVLMGDYCPSQPWKCNRSFQNNFVVGNLECAFSDEPAHKNKAYTSILPEEKFEFLQTTPFRALSLSNNHTGDAGNFPAMRDRLRARFPNITFFGTADQPYAEAVVRGRKVCVIGCMEKSRSRVPEIFPAEKTATLIGRLRPVFDDIYVFPHWGKEGEYTACHAPRQRKMAIRWINAGCDAVFGHHSHHIQGREKIASVWIYYSLGNAFFDHPEGRLYPGTDIGLSIEANQRQIEPWIQLFEGQEIKLVPVDEAGLQTLCPYRSSLSHWQWAKEIGDFYLRKNEASWRLRLRKNLAGTLPWYCLWKIMPLTLWFQIARFFGGGKNES